GPEARATKCLITAGDPRQFIPSPGRIDKYHAPGGLGVRMDSHVSAGYSVPPNYDSMIGSLIVHGPARAPAIARVQVPLSEMIVDGIKTNIPPQRRIMQDEVFRRGEQ